jgi:hypothetical protein
MFNKPALSLIKNVRHLVITFFHLLLSCFLIFFPLVILIEAVCLSPFLHTVLVYL